MSASTDRNTEQQKKTALQRLERLIRRQETAARAAALMVEAATVAARDAGATLDQIAQVCGVTRQAVSYRLNGRAPADAPAAPPGTNPLFE